MGSTGSNATGTYAPANWVALSNDNTSPSSADTVLPGEVTSGALVRAQGSFAHTTGTNSYTITKTFTSDQSIVVSKIGVYNQGPTGGTLVFEDLLTSTANLVSGDQITVSSTVSI